MVDLDLAKLPDQSGRHILVTGGTGGLGREMVERLSAFNPALIAFTGRNQTRADEVIKQLRQRHPRLRIEFLRMDLASLQDVQEATLAFKGKLNDRLDLLICNAGIMAVPAALSPDGYEIQFATNHLGHALLIKHLLPCLRATAAAHGDARVVTLTSEGLAFAPRNEGIAFSTLQTTQDTGFGARWVRYGQSKLAVALYAAQLARLHPTISAVTIHPGVILTDLVNTLGFADRMLVYLTTKSVSPEEGIKSPLWGATVDRRVLENGAYYRPVGEPGKHTRWSQDAALAKKLWEWTQDALKSFDVEA